MAKVDKPVGQVFYREVQSFNQPWLFAAVIVGGLLPILVLYFLIEQRKSLSVEQFVYAIPIVLAIVVINIVFLLKTHLDSVVTDKGIYVRWRPFHRKYREYLWTNVSSVVAKKYVAVSAKPYQTTPQSSAFKMTGSTGIEISLVTGSPVFLGTGKPSRLIDEVSKFVTVIDQLKKKK